MYNEWNKKILKFILPQLDWEIKVKRRIILTTVFVEIEQYYNAWKISVSGKIFYSRKTQSILTLSTYKL